MAGNRHINDKYTIMSANGISTLPTKEQRQHAKLELAAANRKAGGNTNSPAFRARNQYDIQELPTQYVGNTLEDNPNLVLTLGRPWILPLASEEILLETGQDLLEEDGSSLFYTE